MKINVQLAVILLVLMDDFKVQAFSSALTPLHDTNADENTDETRI